MPPHREEDVEPEVENKSRRRRQKKRVKVFEESGLDDEQRRLTRRQQRSLGALIDQSATTDSLQQVRDENNRLFESGVRFTREAVLDADNVEAIVKKNVQQAESMLQVPRYDPLKLVNRLASTCPGKSGLDWLTLGRECALCYNSLPLEVEYLAGPLDAHLPEKAPRQAAKRRTKDTATADAKEVLPEQIDKSKTDANSLAATEQTMKVIRETLKARCKEVKEKSDENEIDGVQFLFNPTSFTQTVENIFQFSFLIKKGDAFIGQRSTSLGESRLLVGLRQYSGGAAALQSVCSFSMRDWKAICEAHDLKKGDIADRKVPKQKRSQQSVE